jgi:hypothetical protein
VRAAKRPLASVRAHVLLHATRVRSFVRAVRAPKREGRRTQFGCRVPPFHVRLQRRHGRRSMRTAWRAARKHLAGDVHTQTVPLDVALFGGRVRARHTLMHEAKGFFFVRRGLGGF